MTRAENVGPNQNVSNVNAPKSKTVKGPDSVGSDTSPISNLVSNVVSNVAKYFNAGKKLGLSSRAANLLADLTTQRFDGTVPNDKGGIIDKKA
jgi:hypothetical protein